MKIKKLSFFLMMITALILLIAATSLCVSAEEVAYPVEGGSIYFDPETGTITGADHKIRDLNIPAEINGVKVTAIADSAFARYTDMQHGVEVEHYFNSVTLPDTLTSIGDSAFFGVRNLKSLTVPTSVKTIGDEAFRQCYDLEEVVIPAGVEKIGFEAFSQCSNLKTATVGAAKIDSDAFWDCNKLNSLILLDGVETIDTGAFAAIGITELTVPSSVRTIGDHAFEMCTELVSLTLNEGLETIGTYAFADTEIEWVDIPLSVVSIGDNAFAYTPFEDALNSCVNHIWSDWAVSTEPTCIKEGTEQRTCSVCLKTESNTLPATGEHIYGDWVVVVNPTCISNGTQKRNCTTCTATQPETIPATGVHAFGEWSVTVEPTESQAGEQSRSCSVCGETEVEELDKLERSNPFTDVADGRWYTEAILYCYDKNYMAGMTPDLFGYKESVTRAMFVTILAKIDGADLSAYTDMSFTDVKPGQWYSTAIEWAASSGYAAGLGEGIFGYKQDVSREQLAMFLYTYSEKNGVDVSRREDISKFTDADRIHDYALDAVKWAVHSDLISGTSGTTLSPRDSATRAEIALIVMNYVEKVKSPAA